MVCLEMSAVGLTVCAGSARIPVHGLCGVGSLFYSEAKCFLYTLVYILITVVFLTCGQYEQISYDFVSIKL